MPKIDLILTNPSGKDIPLDFQTIGDLSHPIMDVSQLAVLHFSIPNSDTPILVWPGDAYYQFKMSYGGFTTTQYVVFSDRGSGQFVYEITHLLKMLNTALQLCLINLISQVTIAGSQTPHISYNYDTDTYSIVCCKAFNNDGINPFITLSVNQPLFYILESMPTIDNGDGTFSFIIVNDPYNTFTPLATGTWTNTPYTQITQEASSLSGYASPRFFVITTSMPIEPEIFSSITSNAGQSTANVVQTFTFDYSKGVRSLLLNNDYHSVVNDYRKVSVNGGVLYQIKMDIYWIDSAGGRHQFFLPPNDSAIITVMME